MDDNQLRPSCEWAEILLEEGQLILDPDGWDRQNFTYSFNIERISKEEFMKRMMRSTSMIVGRGD